METLNGHTTTRATALDFCHRTVLRTSNCQCEQKIAGVAKALDVTSNKNFPQPEIQSSYIRVLLYGPGEDEQKYQMKDVKIG